MINVYLEIGHICRQDRIIKNVNISIVLLVFDICCPKTAKDYAYDLSYNMHYIVAVMGVRLSKDNN